MDDHDAGHPQRWLEVTSGEERSKTVHCPRRGLDVPLPECLGCPRYASLAMDPAGKHVFIDCAWDGPGADDVRAWPCPPSGSS